MKKAYDPGALARLVFHDAKMWSAYEWMGAHKVKENGKTGTRFVLWAPNAKAVSLIADCNNWNKDKTPLERLEEDETLWSVFLEGEHDGMNYQYAILGVDDVWRNKADPYAIEAAKRPNTASKVNAQRKYHWYDTKWMSNKNNDQNQHDKMLIYEVHLGSWKRHEDGSFLSYRELADSLVPYVKEMGYTHIELMPVMEHPLDASWGYQITSYFAPTSRYGRPNDLKYFVDTCHRAGIGVFLDWVPAHFCKDSHGLAKLDGTPLYEYTDPKRAENRSWGTWHFDLTSGEVVSFLISNAIYWLKEFHFDGLRVDAVASMLYLDYDKEKGDWEPNQYGGRENIEAINFLRYLNKIVFQEVPGSIMMAEESTTWPLVTRPEYDGGLGFSYKWNMGWMNDSLRYMELDPIYRKDNQDLLTFSLTYAFSENFILPLSHDEVVHGKHSYLDKMPGDYWQQFANLRAFYGYWMTHPGKKLLFMGGEFGQYIEWNENQALDWHLLDYENHRKTKEYVKDLNHLYQELPMLWQQDGEWGGFQWMDCEDRNNSIIAFERYDEMGRAALVICNFTPQTHEKYKVPVSKYGIYKEIFNSDDEKYGGANNKNINKIQAQDISYKGQKQLIEIKIPPLSMIVLECIELLPYPLIPMDKEEIKRV